MHKFCTTENWFCCFRYTACRKHIKLYIGIMSYDLKYWERRSGVDGEIDMSDDVVYCPEYFTEEKGGHRLGFGDIINVILTLPKYDQYKEITFIGFDQRYQAFVIELLEGKNIVPKFSDFNPDLSAEERYGLVSSNPEGKVRAYHDPHLPSHIELSEAEVGEAEEFLSFDPVLQEKRKMILAVHDKLENPNYSWGVGEWKEFIRGVVAKGISDTVILLPGFKERQLEFNAQLVEYTAEVGIKCVDIYAALQDDPRSGNSFFGDEVCGIRFYAAVARGLSRRGDGHFVGVDSALMHLIAASTVKDSTGLSLDKVAAQGVKLPSCYVLKNGGIGFKPYVSEEGGAKGTLPADVLDWIKQNLNVKVKDLPVLGI